MGKINNTSVSSCWGGCGARGIIIHCWFECKFIQPLWKSMWWFLKNLRIDLPQDLPKPLLGIYPKNLSSSYRDTGPPVSTSLLLEQACIITPDMFFKCEFI